MTKIINPLRGIILVLGWACHTGNVRAESIASADRLTVAVLAFANQTDDRDAAHWCYSLPRMLELSLAGAQAIRVYPAEASNYGMQRMKLKPGSSMTTAQARRIGETIQARCVVWGEYRHHQKNWIITARLLQLENDKPSADFSAAASDWFDVCEKLAVQIVQELGITPSADERARMNCRFTRSKVALRCYSECFALDAERRPFIEIEKRLRQALAADPQCAALHIALAVNLWNQDKVQETSRELRRSFSLDPAPDAYWLLGVLMLHDDDVINAEQDFREAVRMDPDNPENHLALAACHARQRQWTQAVLCQQEALRLNPVSMRSYVQLAANYATQGSRELAVSALAEAEVLRVEDGQEELKIAYVWETLQEIPLAVEHFANYLKTSHKRRVDPDLIDQTATHMQRLQASVESAFLTVAEPHSYTNDTLTEKLRSKLSPDELESIDLPLASTPEMRQWAEEITIDSKDPIEKARALFDALNQRRPPGSGGCRTARQTFADWQNPLIAFSCQEYARLYVAMARDVGLKAYYVNVEKDDKDQRVYHACAGVLVDNKALLVDLSYHGFGIAHQKFSLMDDYQAVVFHLNQLLTISQLEIAIKLQPDDAISQFNLVCALLQNDRLDEARTALQAALKLNADSSMTLLMQGLLAWKDDQPEKAVHLLRKATDQKPSISGPYYLFACLLWEQHRFTEAKTIFRECLEHWPAREYELDAWRRIALINRKFWASGKWDTIADEETAMELETDLWRHKLTDCLSSHLATPLWSPTTHIDLGLIHDNRPEPLAIEAEDLIQQANTDPHDARSRYRAGLILNLLDRRNEGTQKIKEAEAIHRHGLERDPQDLEHIIGLANCLRGTQESRSMAVRATQLAPQAWQSWVALAHSQLWMLYAMCLEGFGIAPDSKESAEFQREALIRRAKSDKDSQAIFAMAQGVLASCAKALEVAPNDPDNFFWTMILRCNTELTTYTLREARGEPVPAQWNTWGANSEVLEQAAKVCRDNPEQLGAITFFRLNAVYCLLPKRINDLPDLTVLKQRQDEVVNPALKRLRELCDSPDSQTAAGAGEMYAALTLFSPMLGAGPKESVEIPTLLARSLRLAPKRCLAWDLAIFYAQQPMKGDNGIHTQETVALERMKVLNTARSHAQIAMWTSNKRLARDEWEKALSLDPENLHYLLNLAAASLDCDHSAESIRTVDQLLERVSALWYDEKHVPRLPALIPSRLRTFAVKQALAGQLEDASATVAKLLGDYPDDTQAQQLSNLLQEPP